jgi:hypothetical protein
VSRSVHVVVFCSTMKRVCSLIKKAIAKKKTNNMVKTLRTPSRFLLLFHAPSIVVEPWSSAAAWSMTLKP